MIRNQVRLMDHAGCNCEMDTRLRIVNVCFCHILAVGVQCPEDAPTLTAKTLDRKYNTMFDTLYSSNE